jgi:adenine-specific DNA-methyltransferase
MEKLDGKSKDIVKDNIDKLKQLFPDVFTDEGVDFDALKGTLGEYVDDKEERYQFTWHGKTQARRLAQTPSTGTLRPCKEESVNWDNTENLFIEGDNLEVLKLLQKSYHKKIKMIYIDPPYNTGKDFVYKDDFRDNIRNYLNLTGQIDGKGKRLSTNSETSGRYHTDWLNMIHPRLKLARNLLRDDGVIFISIDDNEIDNLKKLCNEIFGEDNFIGVFVVNSTPNARDYGHIGKMHEYALFYSKNIYEAKTKLLPEHEKTFKFSDNISGFNVHPLYNSNVAFTPENRPNLYYPFYLHPQSGIGNNLYEIGLEKKDNSIEIYPPKSQKEGVQFVWRWGKEKASKNINKEIIGYKTEDGEYRIVQKMRHSSKLIRSLLIEKMYSSRRGTAEVEELFKKKIFSFPKPRTLLSNFASVALNEEDIVLDFFAGSCTTADAIFELNLQDGGNRKFIMVQFPELCDKDSDSYKAGYKNIAEIGKERIRRVIKKVEKDANLFKNEKLDLGFKVFKLDSSNIAAWDPEFDNVQKDLLNAVDNIKSDRKEEDVLYEILLKYGLDLTVPIEELKIKGKKVFVVGLGALIVCLASDIAIDVIEEIVKLKEKYQPEVEMRIVFKDSSFKNDVVKTNAVQILKQHGVEDVKSI